jgi:hypothetical protein
MPTLDSFNRSLRNAGLAIQIEPAEDCDGSLCHQPIFLEDGSFNFVPPHSHLVEVGPQGPRYYPVFCDFPEVASAEKIGDLFANYPPYLR